MRVEILEDRLTDTDPDTDRHYQLTKGDVITVPDACGARWCGYGWAKDLDGTVPTAERVPGAAQLDVANSKSGVSSTAR